MQKIIIALVLSIAQVCAGVSASTRSVTSPAAVTGPTSSFELPVIPSLGTLDPRDETSIAVNPQNEQVIVGASKVIVGGASGHGETRVAYYFSSNGGHTWGNGVLPVETTEKTWGRASDPSVAADLDGNFYLGVLMLGPNFDSSVYVFKSTDNGQTFGNPQPVVLDLNNPSPRLIDKCYISIDTSPTSVFKNTIYAAWVTKVLQGGQDLSVIRAAHRRPGEAQFSIPKAVGHAGDMRGPSLATGPNGEFCVAWLGMPARVLLFNASTDGGETFLRNVTDKNIHSYVGSLDQLGPAILINGVPRMNSFPVLDVDRSSGPNRGVIYVAWAETTNRIDSDVFVERVTLNSNGATQSSPVKVNNDGAGADQFFPWLSVDPVNGAVNVAFYDRRSDPGGRLVNMYNARSTDGGASFTENTRVSSVSSDPSVQGNVLGSNNNAIGFGDYIAVAARSGKTHLLWTDTRGGSQEIYYGQLDFGSTPPPPPPPGDLSNDTCASPRAVASLPFSEDLNTSSATPSGDDPVSCSGGSDSASVWYSLTTNIDTTIGIDTAGSDYDTVLSVYTGVCASLARVACSDDFGDSISSANRSVLTFAASAGTTYLIEVSGKVSGGNLQLRIGYPTVIGVEYTKGPDGTDALKITGAGFINNDSVVTVTKGGEDNQLPTTFFSGVQQGDGTFTSIFATKKKLKKLVKKKKTVIVRVESPSGSGRISVPFSFTR